MSTPKSLHLVNHALRRQSFANRAHIITRCTGVATDVHNGVAFNRCSRSLSTLRPLATHPLQTSSALSFDPSNQTSYLSLQQQRTIISWVRDKFEQREKGKQAAKLVDQIALMANSPTWTVKMFADEVDETLSSWKTKMPGVGGTKEVQAARQTQKVVKAMVDQLGGDATAEVVSNMDRKQKLKLAIACEMPIDEVNMILKQFRNMELMHRILRYRKTNGIALPTDDAGLKMAMQQDGMKILSNKEKKEMREAASKVQE
ncbi:predicted protein [Thalassiosira pseudonana CCMP1335]|uniref:Signal recognition particle SRP54 subunit M-domain domain-containing protein n=1 Tax=Thalassiosira pseudonana TaxID=35128 RepID=B8BQ95_THAPS|nr:predicted protein [Thalassiosira pseudonana CCMP1335]EED96327.1 predicted protein [Thalassiosira pseudonana CCMP1335]